MKRTVINAFAAVALFVATAFSASAQVKQYSNDVSAFYSLNASNDFEVTVVDGSAYNVVLTVDEAYKEYVVCNVTNQTLNIFLDEKKVPKEVKNLYKGKNAPVPTFKATVTTPESLQNISINDKVVLYYTIEKAGMNEVKVSADGHSVIKQLTIGSPRASINMDRHASGIVDTYCNEVEVVMAGNASLTLNAKQTSLLNLNVTKGASIVTNGDAENVKVIAGGTSKSALNGVAGNGDFNIQGSANVNAANLTLENAKVNMNSLCTLTIAPAASLVIDALNAGATLNYSGDPHVTIGVITKSNVNRK